MQRKVSITETHHRSISNTKQLKKKSHSTNHILSQETGYCKSSVSHPHFHHVQRGPNSKSATFGSKLIFETIILEHNEKFVFRGYENNALSKKKKIKRNLISAQISRIIAFSQYRIREKWIVKFLNRTRNINRSNELCFDKIVEIIKIANGTIRWKYAFHMIIENNRKSLES